MKADAPRRILDTTDQWMDSLQSPFAFVSRLYVCWVFWHSGWLKITDWEQTISLFESVYHVPVLSPLWGAILGTAGELGFSALLAIGIGGRLPAIGLFFVNLMAVLSFQDVLLADEGIAGLRQHQLWGFILLMLIVYGPGSWSADALWRRKAAAPSS